MKPTENTQEDQDISAILEARYGLILHEAGGGGDCLYHSVADQLARNGLVSSQTGQPFTYQALRDLAVAHIRNNPEVYTDEQCTAASSQRPEKIGGALQNRADYLAAHSQAGEFGDDLIRSALSRELGVTITTINYASPEPIIQRQEPENAQLYVYYTGGHYQSLIPIRDNPEFQLLQAQVITHPADEITPTTHIRKISFTKTRPPELPIVRPGRNSTPTQGEKDNLAFIQSMPLELRLENFQVSIEHSAKNSTTQPKLQQIIATSLESIILDNPEMILSIAKDLANKILTDKSQTKKAINDTVVLLKAAPALRTSTLQGSIAKIEQQTSKSLTQIAPTNSSAAQAGLPNPPVTTSSNTRNNANSMKK